MRLISTVLVAIALIVPAAIPAAEVAEDRGAMGLSQSLKRLDIVASVLHTGAHPDDENSSLLAWLARGQGVRTAYLSATRGEGGVNLIGGELLEPLGVIRTEELASARRLDHATQFFTPNYEFGYSKNADDTFTKWAHDQILGDYVRIIRYFRPEIIISRFTGTSRDGHGHHQVSGIITQEAFKVAADPNRFPEYGKPWQAKKLYLNGGMGADQNGQNDPNNQRGVPINIGEFDSALGRSYNEIASEGRSMHRSQGQGGPQERGPRQTRLQLVQKTVTAADDAPIFTGVPYKLPDLAQLDSTLSADLAGLEQRITAIRQKVNLLRPADIVPDLAAALKELQRIKAKSTNEHVRFLLDKKEDDFNEALRLAAGLVVDVLVSDDTVVPRQEFNLTISVTNGGPYAFPDLHAVTDLPAGWEAVYDSSTGSLDPGQRLDQKYKIKVSGTADFTQPYWLRQPRRGDRFVWPQVATGALPDNAPLLPTRAEVTFQGTTIVMKKSAEFRRIDRIYGESRTTLKVVPGLSVTVSPDIAIVPLKGKREKELTVTLENQNPNGAMADVRLVTPAGWTVSPASRSVNLTQQGEKASLQFIVSVPPTAGDFLVQAVATTNSQEVKSGYTAVAYPHIETRYVYAPAQSKVEVIDVATTVSSVGYIEGTGDAIPDALRQLGINVTILSPKEIATADLSKFPAIVIGVRAYAVRDDLRAYNKRLLDYVSNGGTPFPQPYLPNDKKEGAA